MSSIPGAHQTSGAPNLSDPTILYEMHVLTVYILQIPNHPTRGHCQGLQTGFPLEPARCFWLSQVSSLR